MTEIIQVEEDVLEGTDYWLMGAIAVPRAGFDGPVLLTQSDISGSMTLSIYLPNSSTPVYTRTFSKTLNQDGVSECVHAAVADSLWGLDDIGHNLKYQVRQDDLAAYPATLKGGRSYTHVMSIPTARDGIVKAVWVANIRSLH